MKRIRKGDRVVVISGELRGSEGVVLRVLPKQMVAVVENLNKVKRAQKPNEKNKSGGFVEVEAPIALAKLSLIDSKSKRPTKVKYTINKDNKKVRISKRSGHEIGVGGIK